MLAMLGHRVVEDFLLAVELLQPVERQHDDVELRTLVDLADQRARGVVLHEHAVPGLPLEGRDDVLGDRLERTRSQQAYVGGVGRRRQRECREQGDP
jgi:hypothetical protein